MSPSRTHPSVLKSLVAALKEIRHMPRNLARFLDTFSQVTVVFLALYLGLATVGLGVA